LNAERAQTWPKPIYANRAALPIAGAMFVAILIFGAIW
jgi:hypothetical protein